MVKLKFLATLVTLLLGVSYLFASVIPSHNSSKSIENYGYIWYKCTNGSWEVDEGRVLFYNDEHDSFCDPSSAMASSYEVTRATGIRSIIPECDTSSVVLNNVYSTPLSNSECDFPYGLKVAS
ncbi:35803_t:CDS:2, partial [Gigaspora margarita]